MLGVELLDEGERPPLGLGRWVHGTSISIQYTGCQPSLVVVYRGHESGRNPETGF